MVNIGSCWPFSALYDSPCFQWNIPSNSKTCSMKSILFNALENEDLLNKVLILNANLFNKQTHTFNNSMQALTTPENFSWPMGNLIIELMLPLWKLKFP